MPPTVVSRQSDFAISTIALAGAVLCGLVISMSANLLTLLVVGLLVGSFLLILPTQIMVWMTLFFTFFIQGTIQYYGKTGMATWVAFGLSALVLLKMIAAPFGHKTPGRDNLSTSRSVSFFLAAYLGSFFISFLINLPSLGQSISAFKNALPAFGILLAIGWGNWPSKSVTQLWWLIVVAGLVQLPPVVHQHFFVASSRIDQGWDSVVGTMGGSQEGGGLNAMLVLLVIVSLVFVLARHKRGLIAPGPLMIVGITSLAVMILGEVKAVFIWLPIALVLLYWRAMIRNPGRAIPALAGIAVLLAVIFSVYQALYWEKQNLSRKTFAERIEKLGGYFFDADQINFRTGEVSRGASVALWIHDAKSTPITRLFGYGPGASKSVSVLGPGEVARRYTPLGIDSTTVAAMLWDIGLLGFFSYTAFLLAPIMLARRLIKRPHLPPQAAAEIESATITLILMSSLLIYNRTLVDQIVTQALVYLAIGTIVFHARHATSEPQKTANHRR